MTTTDTSSLTIEPVAGALGATVTGLDLTKVTTSDEIEGLRRALAEHLVVFLPEQDLSLDDLERVTDLLGGRDITPFVDPLEDRPYVIRVMIRKLAEGDKLLAQGKTVEEVARHLEISEQTFHRWRNQYGGMKADDAKRLKELERENTAAEEDRGRPGLDIDMLKEVNRGNF